MCCPACRPQPAVGPSTRELLVAQRLRDLRKRLGERDLAATEPQRDLAARGRVYVGGSERHDPGGRFAVERQHAAGEPIACIELGIVSSRRRIAKRCSSSIAERGGRGPLASCR